MTCNESPRAEPRPCTSSPFPYGTMSVAESARGCLTRNLIGAIIVAVITLAVSHVTYSRQTDMSAPERPKGMQKMVRELRSAYAAFNRGDYDATVAVLDPEIEWTEPAAFPGGGVYHGRKEVEGYLRQSRSRWAEGSSKPERFIAAGDRIVVFVFARYRAKGSKNWQEVKLADVYTIRDGKIVQMNAFADRQQALRWAGAKAP